MNSILSIQNKTFLWLLVCHLWEKFQWGIIWTNLRYKFWMLPFRKYEQELPSERRTAYTDKFRTTLPKLYPCPQPKILTITDSMPSVKFFVGIWRQSDKEERFKPDLHAIYSQMDGLAYNLSIRWVISCLRELQDTKEIPPFLTFLHAYLYFIFITVS